MHLLEYPAKQQVKKELSKQNKLDCSDKMMAWEAFWVKLFQLKFCLVACSYFMKYNLNKHCFHFKDSEN